MENQLSNETKEEKVDLRIQLIKVIANWHLFLTFILSFLIITFFLNRYSTNIYKIKTSVLIQKDNNSVGAENFLLGGGLLNGN